jgi:hypothetical protein
VAGGCLGDWKPTLLAAGLERVSSAKLSMELMKLQTDLEEGPVKIAPCLEATGASV